MHENMTFDIGKLNFVSHQFVFRCFPSLDSRSPLDIEMSLHTYTIYKKGMLGLGGGGGGQGCRSKRLTNINRFAKRTVFISLLGINCTNNI